MSTSLMNSAVFPELQEPPVQGFAQGLTSTPVVFPASRWSLGPLPLPEELKRRRNRINNNSGGEIFSKLEKIIMEGFKLTIDNIQKKKEDNRKDEKDYEEKKEEVYDKLFSPSGLGKRVAFLTGYLVSPFLIPLAMATVFIVGVFIYYNFIKI